MKKILLILLFFHLTLFVVACVEKKPVSIPEQMKSVPEYQEIYLDNGDQLQIDFPFWPELGQVVQYVRKDGIITLPVLGDMFVAGLTTAQLDEKLTMLYGKILKNPDVIVVLLTVANESVFVAGEVMRPGSYKYNRKMTILEAIFTAGSFNNKSAELSNVVVIRHVGEKRHVAILDLEKAVMGETEPFYLASHDIIFVPRTKIDVINQWVNQYLNQIIAFAPFSFSYYPKNDWTLFVGGSQ